MANLYSNLVGIPIIEMSQREAICCCGKGESVSRTNIKFNCDICNTPFKAHDNVYYIAPFNDYVCEECCEDIIKCYNFTLCNNNETINNFNNVAYACNLDYSATLINGVIRIVDNSTNNILQIWDRNSTINSRIIRQTVRMHL